MSMILISINVSQPIEFAHGDTPVMTGIFKQPVEGEVAVRQLNLDGDGQADLVNHGGESKAVYAYSLDHYDYWREALNRDELPYGQFGENLTIAGLDEAKLCIGDQLQIGDALFTISQPRVPCFKLGIRFSDKRVPRMFAQSLRTGFYLRVLNEGTIRAGDSVNVIAKGVGSLSIRSLFDAYLKPNDREALRLLARAIEYRSCRRNGAGISVSAWRAGRTRTLSHASPAARSRLKAGEQPSQASDDTCDRSHPLD